MTVKGQAAGTGKTETAAAGATAMGAAGFTALALAREMECLCTGGICAELDNSSAEQQV